MSHPKTRSVRKDRILQRISDQVGDLVIYDVNIPYLVQRGELTVDEMVAQFRATLEDSL